MNRLLIVPLLLLLTGCGDYRVRDIFPRYCSVQAGDKSMSLDAGAGCLWSEPVYNKEMTIAYIVRSRGSYFKGTSTENIVRVTEDGVVKTVLDAALPSGEVLWIERVSDDGRQLLVELLYVTEQTEDTVRCSSRPVILDVDTGNIISELFVQSSGSTTNRLPGSNRLQAERRIGLGRDLGPAR